MGLITSDPVKRERYQDLLDQCDEHRKDFKWRTEINGINVGPFYMYPFCEDGRTLLITKYGENTAGMGWYIIDGFNNDGTFSISRNTGFGSDLKMGRAQADALYARIEKNALAQSLTKTSNRWD